MEITDATITSIPRCTTQISNSIQNHNHIINKESSTMNLLPNTNNIQCVRTSLHRQWPKYSTLIKAFTEICINKFLPLYIFSDTNDISITLHRFPTMDKKFTLVGKHINAINHQYHLTQFKIIRHIQIHPKFLKMWKHLTITLFRPIECIVIFCDFSHGDMSPKSSL